MNFDGKVVLVTGSSSGIGAAIAIQFSQLGAKVSLVARNEKKLNEVAKKCKDPLVIIADVTKEDDAKRIVADTVKHYGQLDVLVNSAGICVGASILAENTMKAYDQVMATNLRAIVHLTHLAAPHIIKTKGNIVNISSISALRTISKEGFAYNTAKAGLDHFTRSIAAELASSGVRVNAVNPGMVKTDLLTNMGLPEEQREPIYEFMKTFTAQKRVSDPEEIAEVVVFLASDKAKAITGANYLCDNGVSVKVD
ncbi:uncharacterized protein LOC113492069 [Trichoplusia ni]|uniref:Uncharacterized protein LOC113492069 n=1 Tax=Trichoplusia ni TaxID=7111 RepID=A0A7E5VA47_TRINI|nr:uncharacterized protein LOC113492069 [Trichoplusia ni]